MQIPFLSLKAQNSPYEAELKLIFEEFLDSGYYMLGKNVQNFEADFASYTDAKHCVGVANGLDALELILSSLSFPEGSEIIVPANTYYASILSIINSGYTPILIEPKLEDYLIDTDQLKSKISNKTVAVMAVNLYGRMCDFTSLSTICKENSLKLIVDAAQSHGAKYNDSRDCPGADAIAYSFYPTKNLGALADAGAVVTSDETIAKTVKATRNYGSEVRYQFDYAGKNSRLSELQAGFLSLKLKTLDQDIEKRRTIANRYLTEISSDKIILPPSDKVWKDAWHLFVIRTNDRSSFTAYLKDRGIGFDIHYPVPPHKQKALEKYCTYKLPITEEIHKTVVSIPLNPLLKQEEVDYIIDTINQY